MIPALSQQTLPFFLSRVSGEKNLESPLSASEAVHPRFRPFRKIRYPSGTTAAENLPSQNSRRISPKFSQKSSHPALFSRFPNISSISSLRAPNSIFFSSVSTYSYTFIFTQDFPLFPRILKRLPDVAAHLPQHILTFIVNRLL